MKVNYKEKVYNLPDFLVVGGAKCGTTSLFYYLEQHPEIFAPSEKEPHFFSFFNTPPQYASPAELRVISKISDYSNFYKNADESQLLCEASTSYLYDYENTIKNIKDVYGEQFRKLKIVILLRNPADRAWSQYWQFKKFYHEPLEFEETIKASVIKDRLKKNWNYYYDYIGFGKYYNQVKAYLDEFEDVKVIFQESFLDDSKGTLESTLNFLRLNLDFDIETGRKFNPSGGTKKNLYGVLWCIKSKTQTFSLFKLILPLKIRKKLIYFFMDKALEKKPLNDKLREVLSEEFKDDNQKLFDLLNRKEITLWN